jgi:hypothetical protein
VVDKIDNLEADIILRNNFKDHYELLDKDIRRKIE